MIRNIDNLTLKEYLDIVNSEHKTLPSSAFSNNVEEYSFENAFNKVLKTFNRYGIEFSLKEQVTDRWANAHNYLKKDENDEHLRNENKELIFHDSESIKTIIPENKRFVYEHAIYDETHNKIATRTQDEWGCLLIRTASEYEGFGLGEELLFEHRKIRPFRQTGGYSPQGLNCEQKAFKRRVVDNLEKGIYNNLSDDRKEEIIKSIDYINTFAERYESEADKEKYDYSKEEDYLYHVDERFVLIYNRKLYDLLSDKDIDIYSDRSQMLLGDGIVGYIDLMGNSESDRIFKSYFKNEETLKTLLNLLGSSNQVNEFEIYKRDAEMFGSLSSISISQGRDFCHLKLNEKPFEDFKLKHAVSQKVKKSLDPYEEKWFVIHETADKLAEEKMNKNDDVYKKNLSNKSKSRKSIKP